MRLFSRTLAVLVFLVGIGFAGFSIPAAAEGRRPLSTAPSTDSAPQATIERIRLSETHMGERLWEVEADKGEIFEDRGIAVLSRVVQPVRIVIHNGKESLTTFAEKAVVDLVTKDLRLSGGVRSESSRGTQFFAEQVTWSAGKRQIITDVPMVIKEAGLEIQGKGMVADTILERMTIREPVTTLVTLSRVREHGR